MHAYDESKSEWNVYCHCFQSYGGHVLRMKIMSKSCLMFEWSWGGLSGDIDVQLKCLIEIIYRSVNYKRKTVNRKVERRGQPWFDNKCLRVRRRLFNLLKLDRESNSNTMKDNYMVLEREYKMLCKSEKQEYFNSTSIFVRLKTVRNNKDFGTVLIHLKVKVSDVICA